MHCNQDRLSLYMDGDLLLPDRVDLERHLSVCSECRRQLVELRRVDRMLMTWGNQRLTIPVETEARITKAVERRPRIAALLRWSRMMPAAVGTSIAALLVVVSANQGWTSARSQRPVPNNITHIIAKQSVPLSNARRVSAILPGHGSSRPAIRTHSALQLDVE